jgi:hypothetical protein
MIPAFLSYSHKDRHLAGGIKIDLDYYGFDAFLAHEDLQPSTEWQQVILLKLRACSVFLPLLTESFAKSDWTDQEIGVAVALRKIIVPMKLTLDPYGFIGRYQAQPFAGAADDASIYPPVIEEACWNIVKTLASHKKIASQVRDGVIAAFGRSGSFSEAGKFARRMQSLELFSDEQLNDILRVSAANDQISHGFDARAIVNDLIRRAAKRVDRSLVRKFVEAQEWDGARGAIGLGD